MAVDKTLLSEFRLPVPVEEDLEIEIDDTADIVDSDIVIIESEDGTVTVDFSPQDSVMLMSDRIARLTSERATSDEIRDVAVDEGMRTLRQDGWLKVAQGLTSIHEVLRVVAS